MGFRTPGLNNDAHATNFQTFGRTNPKFRCRRYGHLDRLLNAAMARRNAILDDIERYDYLFYVPLALSVVVEEVHELGNGHANESQGTHAQFSEAAPALAPPQGGQS
jgi:hypothetical protein